MDMNKINKSLITSRIFSRTLLAISGALLLGTPFATDPELAGGIQSAQVCWFQGSACLWAVCVCVSFLNGQTVHGLSFTWPDGLILGFGCIVAITYPWGLHPEPEKLLFGAQLLVLWFTWRYVLRAYPELKLFFLVLLLSTGLLEAIRGMEQLYGWRESNHSLFRLTGSFFNPGPYSGYLAMLLPVCLGIMLRLEKQKKASQWQEYRGFYYFAWATLAAILMILPAGMSRSAWIAALVACLGVYGFYRNGWARCKRMGKQAGVAGRIGLAVFVILLMAGATIAYQMKKDSAQGRFLMWKVTARACLKHPLQGTGLGGFPAAYAAGQAGYFTSGKASEGEKRVAGAPEYAFNEYLQIGLETGIGGGLVFLFWIGSCLRHGIRGKMYGICGGIVALGIFAASSYPLQLPPFWVALLLLGAYTVQADHWQLTDSQVSALNRETADSKIARSELVSPQLVSPELVNFPPTDTPDVGPAKKSSGYRFRVPLAPIVKIAGLAGILIGISWMQKGYYAHYKQWNKARTLYHAQAYKQAVENYAVLYEPLRHKPEFLFEGAQCLAKTGRPAEANRWLARAVRLSADPMLYYVMARNEQALGKYEEAEKHLLYAVDVLPERIYPYYLLVKLYAEPAFRHPEKMEAAARKVLEKKAKVESTAIREMREEVKKIRLDSISNKLNPKAISAL